MCFVNKQLYNNKLIKNLNKHKNSLTLCVIYTLGLTKFKDHKNPSWKVNFC